jgi:hypothetical protein
MSWLVFARYPPMQRMAVAKGIFTKRGIYPEAKVEYRIKKRICYPDRKKYREKDNLTGIPKSMLSR